MYRTQTDGRKQIRHSGHDYSSSCIYFVTICVDWNVECLGSIRNNVMELNPYGKIIEQQWLWLAEQYPYITLDVYVVMPNHFHGIVIINNTDYEHDINAHTEREGRDPPLRTFRDATKRTAPITEMMGAFKSTSSKLIHRVGLIDFAWQRSYHDRIVRNLVELDNIRTYIKNNPTKWESDPARHVRRGGS